MSMDNIKSLLHFNDNVNDETNLVVWQKGSSNVKVDNTIAKFGTGSLCTYNSQLVGKNSVIWNLNSSGEYEFEFFLYLTANGGTRYLIRLYNSNTLNLTLTLTTAGQIVFLCETWGYSSSVLGTTALTVKTWHHIVFRISEQKAKVFLDGEEDISADLPENTLLTNTQIYLGNFNNTSYQMYIDEFVFRHSAGTSNPVIPTEPYDYTTINISPKTKRNFGTIKSLLHFDYPYFKEPNDGLGDEIGLETWTKNGTVALYGNTIPKAGTLVPKFGYRCLYTKKGSVQCDNESGIWNLNSNGSYEIGMFVQIDQTDNEKNIFSLMDTDKTTAILKLYLPAGGVLNFVSSCFGADNISGSTALTTKTWHHILMRISGGCMRVYLDGNLEITSELSLETELSVGQVRIGNDTSSYIVYVDEFVFRHNASKIRPNVPTAPYNGHLDTDSIGGYGTGENGDVTISSDTQINSYGLINSITDCHTFTVSSWSNGSLIPAIGSELMIHVTAPIYTFGSDYKLVGLYAFAKIASINETEVVLDRDISVENGDDFTLLDGFQGAYYIQAITVPNYSTLTVNSGYKVTPLTWSNTKGGGIVAFRCTGDCIVNGSIITHGAGTTRYDLHQMTHSLMIDRFSCSKGGGIFIACGGTFTAPSTARLGATWSGKGDSSNGHGAAGYGSKGESVYINSSTTGSGGNGGVGGGGGGAVKRQDNVYATGANVGDNGKINSNIGSGGGGCNGAGASVTSGTLPCSGGKGGSQGQDSLNGSMGTAATQSNGYYLFGGSGGGAPGGNGGNSQYTTNNTSKQSKVAGVAGACIILVCEQLAIDQAAISTGGSSPGLVNMTSSGYRTGSGGGGGTGFCYIATRELIDE